MIIRETSRICYLFKIKINFLMNHYIRIYDRINDLSILMKLLLLQVNEKGFAKSVFLGRSFFFSTSSDPRMKMHRK